MLAQEDRLDLRLGGRNLVGGIGRDQDFKEGIRPVEGLGRADRDEGDVVEVEPEAHALRAEDPDHSEFHPADRNDLAEGAFLAEQLAPDRVAQDADALLGGIEAGGEKLASPHREVSRLRKIVGRPDDGNVALAVPETDRARPEEQGADVAKRPDLGSEGVGVLLAKLPGGGRSEDRRPPGRLHLARHDQDDVRPEVRQGLANISLHSLPDADEEDDGRNPDDDPEKR